MASARPPIRKIILYAHAQGNGETFTIPSTMAIKYFGELGKSCAIISKNPAGRICTSKSIFSRTAMHYKKNYLNSELPEEDLSTLTNPVRCTDEGCTFASSTSERMIQHIHKSHIPRVHRNNANLRRKLHSSTGNRGFFINPNNRHSDYMLLSPSIHEESIHPPRTIFPNLIIGTAEEERDRPSYFEAGVKECIGESMLKNIIKLEKLIDVHSKIRPGIFTKFQWVPHGAALTLRDIIRYITELYPGERIDFYIVACLSGVSKPIINAVKESMRIEEEPFTALKALGHVAEGTPYHSANTRPTKRARLGGSRSRRSRRSRRRRRSNSRSAARPHAKDE